jgi:hypothetical protein
VLIRVDGAGSSQQLLGWLTARRLSCSVGFALPAGSRCSATPGHAARRWEPKRLGLRLFATAASLAHGARVLVAHLATDHAWTGRVLTGRAAITVCPPAPADRLDKPLLPKPGPRPARGLGGRPRTRPPRHTHQAPWRPHRPPSRETITNTKINKRSG